MKRIDLSTLTQDPVLKRFFRNGPDAGAVIIEAPKPVLPTLARELEVA